MPQYQPSPQRRKNARPPREVVLKREADAWEMRTTKWLTHQEIAQKLEVDRSTVTRILKRISKRVNSKLDQLVTEEKIKQIETYNYMVKEALHAWEESKGGRQAIQTISPGEAVKLSDGKVEVRKTSGGKATIVQTANTSPGDYKYLDLAMKAMDKISELMGFKERYLPEDSGGGVAQPGRVLIYIPNNNREQFPVIEGQVK